MKAKYIVAEKPKEEPSEAEIKKAIEKGIDWIKNQGFDCVNIRTPELYIPNVADADSYMKYKKLEEIRTRMNARLSRKRVDERK